MDEQRIREIIQEELARKEAAAVTAANDSADTLTDSIVKAITDSLSIDGSFPKHS
ncbi:hypothetical protein HQN90_17650 [Paenibacillus alba]|uniref:hypothetical protein n=1 Tax=Paenibacillus alba TaxID=1197127 RepID=UPI001565037A|nr:hypothetical protein [Paenibacillus alba]NQX67949.1 hypothetical protein [Paenibacillus alba]